jgi:hypothetical protein
MLEPGVLVDVCLTHSNSEVAGGKLASESNAPTVPYSSNFFV